MTRRPGLDLNIPPFQRGKNVIRVSLGRRLVNPLPVAQRTIALTYTLKKKRLRQNGRFFFSPTANATLVFSRYGKKCAARKRGRPSKAEVRQAALCLQRVVRCAKQTGHSEEKVRQRTTAPPTYNPARNQSQCSSNIACCT